MSHLYRRCSKCGATQASNPELRMHRFPALIKNNENISQLLSWATFCFPDKDWSDSKAIGSLYKSSKVICSRHFADSAYTTTDKIRLQKQAVPLHTEVHGESNPEQPKKPTGSLACSEHLYNNIRMIEQSMTLIVIKSFASESAKKQLAKIFIFLIL